MKKLEEILETKLPLHINRNVDISNDLIEIPKSKIKNKEEFLKSWVYGDRYSMIDYPDIFERFHEPHQSANLQEQPDKNSAGVSRALP